MKVRTDSSAAGAMVQRQGIGRVRRLDASLQWAQQKETKKAFSAVAIPSELNCADISAKSLTRRRLFGLLYMMMAEMSTRSWNTSTESRGNQEDDEDEGHQDWLATFDG